MFFTVIVPAYNVQDYLGNCIKSILSQTCEDYEIIIVDDGSTDSTRKIADEIKTWDKRINIIHQENKGLGGARNTGIENSSGDYLFFLDSDDYINKNLLMLAKSEIEKNDLDIFIFGLEPVYSYAENVMNQEIKLERIQNLNNHSYLIDGGISACNKIVRRSLFIDNNIRFPEKMLYEDVATTPMFAINSQKIEKTDSVLYYYLQREGSIIASPNLDRVFEIKNGFNRVIKYFKERNAFECFKEELEFLAIIHCWHFTLIRVFLSEGYGKKDIEAAKNYLIELFPNYKLNKYIRNTDNLTNNQVDLRIFNLMMKGKFRWIKIRYYSFKNIKILLKRIIKKKK